MTTHTITRAPEPANDFADLGKRLARFGRALQNPSTTVAELTELALACGIKLKLRVAADQESQSV